MSSRTNLFCGLMVVLFGIVGEVSGRVYPPILAYRLDETAPNSVVYDSSGNELHGQIVGPDDRWDPNGYSGGCLAFNDDIAVIAPANSLSLPRTLDSILIQVWLKDAWRPDANNWVFDIGAGEHRVQAAVVTQPEQQVYWRAGNDSNDVLTWGLAGRDPNKLTGWHFWVFYKYEWYDEMGIYFDCELVASSNDVDDTLVNCVNEPFRIGALTWHDHDFVGKMDNFGLYYYLPDYQILEECLPWPLHVYAWDPSPSDGQTDVRLDVNLTWMPGDYAASHDVYLGLDWDDVNDATTAWAGIYSGRQDACEYDPPGNLEFNTIYYWRIDEVNEPNVVKGFVWSFTTANYVTVDDFESYDQDSNKIYFTWADGFENHSGSEVALGIAPGQPVHGGNQSMIYLYRNDFDWGAGYYSEAWLPFESPQNWQGAGVKILTLYFYGDPNNDVNDTEQMYVGVQDSNGNYAEVRYGDYGEDMNDLKVAEWHQWNIVLSYLHDVNLAGVEKIHIGFGGRDNSTVPGGEGMVYFDDIRLYPPVCLWPPPADLNCDCVVNYKDLKIMADEWLSVSLLMADLYPDGRTNLRDYALLAAGWLEEGAWWPE